jgi:hypothetical protein
MEKLFSEIQNACNVARAGVVVDVRPLLLVANELTPEEREAFSVSVANPTSVDQYARAALQLLTSEVGQRAARRLLLKG